MPTQPFAEGSVRLDARMMGLQVLNPSNKLDIIDPTQIKEGDVLVGFGSDGPHANGFSLVRRVIAENPDLLSKEEIISILAPTRLYHDVVADVRTAGVIPKAMAHITGGGLPENLERLFQNGLGADLKIPFWNNPPMRKMFEFIDAADKFHTFNMGFGWVCIVDAADADKILSAGNGGVVLGKVVANEGVRVQEAAK